MTDRTLSSLEDATSTGEISTVIALVPVGTALGPLGLPIVQPRFEDLFDDNTVTLFKPTLDSQPTIDNVAAKQVHRLSVGDLNSTSEMDAVFAAQIIDLTAPDLEVTTDITPVTATVFHNLAVDDASTDTAVDAVAATTQQDLTVGELDSTGEITTGEVIQGIAVAAVYLTSVGSIDAPAITQDHNPGFAEIEAEAEVDVTAATVTVNLSVADANALHELEGTIWSYWLAADMNGVCEIDSIEATKPYMVRRSWASAILIGV